MADVSVLPGGQITAVSSIPTSLKSPPQTRRTTFCSSGTRVVQSGLLAQIRGPPLVLMAAQGRAVFLLRPAEVFFLKHTHLILYILRYASGRFANWANVHTHGLLLPD